MSFNDSEFFNVQIENYNGPLDVLLDLAKAQKVNLEKNLQKFYMEALLTVKILIN